MSIENNNTLVAIMDITKNVVDIIRDARKDGGSQGHRLQAMKLVVSSILIKLRYLIYLCLQNQMVKEHADAACIPGILLSCSKELIRARNDTTNNMVNWFNIGHDDPRIFKHPWQSKAQAWDAKGDTSFDLPQDTTAGPPNPTPSPQTSTPLPPSDRSSDKGKGKAIDVDTKEESEDRTKKRKTPVIEVSIPLPAKSSMKARKRAKSEKAPKSKEFVDSGDEEGESNMVSKSRVRSAL
jgi:hypothetical protein